MDPIKKLPRPKKVSKKPSKTPWARKLSGNIKKRKASSKGVLVAKNSKPKPKRAPKRSTRHITIYNYYKKSKGYAISRLFMEHITSIVPKNGTILELGSGLGSYVLGKRFKIICVEHNSRWVGMYRKIHYIHAPLISIDGETSWYDIDILKSKIKHLKYDLLLIDGPPKRDRLNFFKYTSLFDSSVPWAFDDVKRRHYLKPFVKWLTKTNRRSVLRRQSHLESFTIPKSTSLDDRPSWKDLREFLKQEFPVRKDKWHIILK